MIGYKGPSRSASGAAELGSKEARGEPGEAGSCADADASPRFTSVELDEFGSASPPGVWGPVEWGVASDAIFKQEAVKCAVGEFVQQQLKRGRVVHVDDTCTPCVRMYSPTRASGPPQAYAPKRRCSYAVVSRFPWISHVPAGVSVNVALPPARTRESRNVAGTNGQRWE